MYARSVQKPLWQLVTDFTPEEFVNATAFRYISDAVTKEEALDLLKKLEPTKAERIEKVKKLGYPAYTTSVGCKVRSMEQVKIAKHRYGRGWLQR